LTVGAGYWEVVEAVVVVARAMEQRLAFVKTYTYNSKIYIKHDIIVNPCDCGGAGAASSSLLAALVDVSFSFIGRSLFGAVRQSKSDSKMG